LLRRKDIEELSRQIEKLENKESILHSKIETINTELKINQEKLNVTIAENDKIKEKINTYSKLNFNNLLDYDDLYPSYKDNYDYTKNNIDDLRRGSFYFDFISENPQQEVSNFNPEGEYPLLNGTFISYWNNSLKLKQPFAKGKFKNGLKDGKWIYYSCNGKKYCEGAYVNGIKEGRWINYEACNEKFKYFDPKPTKINSVNWKSFGYFNLLEEMNYYIFEYDHYQISYIGLSQLIDSIQKEIIYYHNGLASDTLYYTNNLDQIKLKIARKSGEIFYDNNQLFVKNYEFDRNKYKYNMAFFPTDNKTLIFYYRNGQIAYQYLMNETKYTGISYYENGNLKSKCEFNEGSDSGKINIYDIKGKLIFVDVEYEPIPGYQCPCQ
jgi:antitoxin component YwqK of YwqJK toxin-antitoxin module